MNVGRKLLVRQYLKMTQNVWEISNSGNFDHIKENAVMWTSTSELRE